MSRQVPPPPVALGCCHPYERKFASKAVLSAGRMQLILPATRPTPHGASRLVQAMPAWSVRTRRAPSRHGRDAMVYSHTVTAMDDMSTLSPSTFLLLGAAFSISFRATANSFCCSRPGAQTVRLIFTGTIVLLTIFYESVSIPAALQSTAFPRTLVTHGSTSSSRS